MSTPPITGGAILRAIRRHLGLSQEAAAANAALSKRTIESVERGQGNPRPNTLSTLAATFGADHMVLEAGTTARPVLAVPAIAPISAGDFLGLLDGVDHADSLAPHIDNINTAAMARDAVRLFQQLADTYQDVSPSDRLVYLHDLCDLVAQLRARGWIARCGSYRDDALGNVVVFRLHPTHAHGATLFVTGSWDATVSGAQIVWSPDNA